MVDLDNTVIVDVEPSVPIRTAEAFAARRMMDRITDRFDMTPDKLVGDTGYGSAEMLGWLVDERGIAPHIPVWDKSKRTDGTYSRADFVYDPATDSYKCSGNKELRTYLQNVSKPQKPNDTVFRDAFAQVAQIICQPPVAIDLIAVRPSLADRFSLPLIFKRALG